MIDYTHYKCENFVADSYFRQSVKQPDETSLQYWRAFIAEHPEQADVVAQAAEVVRRLSRATAISEPADPVEEALIWSAVGEQVLANQPKTRFRVFDRHRLPHWTWLVAAASVIGVLGLSWWTQVANPVESGSISQPSVAVRGSNPFTLQKNTTGQPQTVALPDGSSVILQKGSQVGHPTTFTGSTRPVYLVGEAYFEVTKDPAHPFVVHAGELLASVLGTSFSVRADDRNVIVTVRTGRVEIFTQSNQVRQQKINSPALSRVVLTQHQQITFARRENRLTLLEKAPPILIAPQGLPLTASRFLYEATPVGDVFDELEKTYGIKITYDKNTVGNCLLTADLSDEPLLTKMDIVCRSIEANYKRQLTQFVVSGSGCRP